MHRETVVEKNPNNLNLERKALNRNEKDYAITVSVNVIIRMLVTLHDGGSIKRTNLAGMTRMNYGNCVKYVNLLKLLGWVDVIYNNDSHHVVITESGADIIKRFESGTELLLKVNN